MLATLKLLIKIILCNHHYKKENIDRISFHRKSICIKCGKVEDNFEM